MRVLVTGAGGFIGSHLVKDQLGRNREVIALDLDVSALAPLTDNTKLQVVRGDIADRCVVEEVTRGVDVVFHAFPGIGRPSNSVLRREERHELHVRVLVNPIDRGSARGVNPGLIGDQPHSASRHEMERVLEEDFNPGANRAEPLVVSLV